MGRVLACFSLKGGVGKTTLAVHLADAAARGGRRTLLWDLDPQGAATRILVAGEGTAGIRLRLAARRAATGEVPPLELVQPARLSGIDVLPADVSLRTLDRAYHTLGKGRRLAKVLRGLAAYDRIILDCPPALSDTAEQAMRAADVVLVPTTPSALARAAVAMVEEHANAIGKVHARLLPVLNMVDRRRARHRQVADELADWPQLPLSGHFERLGEDGQTAAAAAPRSTAAAAMASLYVTIEQALAAAPPR